MLVYTEHLFWQSFRFSFRPRPFHHSAQFWCRNSIAAGLVFHLPLFAVFDCIREQAADLFQSCKVSTSNTFRSFDNCVQYNDCCPLSPFVALFVPVRSVPRQFPWKGLELDASLIWYFLARTFPQLKITTPTSCAHSASESTVCLRYEALLACLPVRRRCQDLPYLALKY